MKTDNIIDKLKQKIPVTLSDENINKYVKTVLKDIDYIYSYLIFSDYDNGILQGWTIEYSFSQVDEYNMIAAKTAANDIVNSILNNKNTIKSVIGYKQPPIDLMLELFEPFVNKLVLEQCHKWPSLEYDDAHVMCQMVMVNLYNKGYYIHGNLLKRSFENEVLLSLSGERKKPEMVSLDAVCFSNGSNDPLTLSDMLPTDRIAEENKESDEFIKLVFDEVKDIIIDLVGERQFDALLRDYGNKHSRPWSWKLMKQIKEKFKSLGITWESFERYL